MIAARATRALRSGAVPGVVTVATMIATPLCRPRGSARRALASVVIAGLGTATATRAVQRWGSRRTTSAGVAVGAATFALERIGTATGVPFGRYHYTDALRPQVAGVPLVVPAAWFAMAIPAREAAHAALGDRSTPLRRIAVGAVALTAWDLFLDPQMTGEGYWVWARPGRYRGIPMSNYLGWLIVAAGVMALLERVLPPTAEAEPALVGAYAGMAAMETVGFARYFGDRLVAGVGGAGMIPVAAFAAVRVVQAQRWSGRAGFAGGRRR